MNIYAIVPPSNAVMSCVRPMVVKNISGICTVLKRIYVAEKRKLALSNAAMPIFKTFIFTNLYERTNMRLERMMKGMRYAKYIVKVPKRTPLKKVAMEGRKRTGITFFNPYLEIEKIKRKFMILPMTS